MSKYKKYADWDTAVKELKRDKKPDAMGAAFSENNFNSLLHAMLNDLSFKEEVVKYGAGNETIEDVEEVMVSQDFRKFLKGVLVEAGMDDADAAVVETEDFKIKNVDGLYELISSSIYQFMNLGHQFKFMPKKDFIATIGIRSFDAIDEDRNVHNPATGEKYVQHYKCAPHRELCGKSHAPAYMVSRERV